MLFEPPATQEAADVANADDNEGGLIIAFDDEGNEITIDGECSFDETDFDDVPEFLEERLTPERLDKVCEAVHADDGKSLIEKVIDNVPTALIVLLPLMALVLKALYPLSRRYYVEHLLFFVHLHAFMFLLITLQVLFARLAAAIALPETATVLTIVATSFYIPVYLFIAMRRVYGQGRLITFLKYIVLTLAYITGFSTIIGITFALAAFSI